MPFVDCNDIDVLPFGTVDVHCIAIESLRLEVPPFGEVSVIEAGGACIGAVILKVLPLTGKIPAAATYNWKPLPERLVGTFQLYEPVFEMLVAITKTLVLFCNRDKSTFEIPVDVQVKL